MSILGRFARLTSAIRERLRRDTRRTALVGAGALLALVTLYVLFAEPAGPGEDVATAPPVATTSVVRVTAGSYAAEVAGFAEIRPRWSATLRAEVAGTLVWVADGFQPGAQVRAGQVLAVVDSTAWTANLAEAENRLAAAELELLRQEQEAEEARRSWEASGLTGEPDSRLVLREPQIRVARSERDAALAARDWAARQLARTRVRAPFAGVITMRHVSPGESVLDGEPVADIYATESFELALPIPEAQRRILPETVVGTTADLVSSDGSGRWGATVVREGGVIDPATRMRTLYLELTDAHTAETTPLPGAFVQVLMRGREVDGLLEVPEGALTRSGHIWYVDGDALGRFEAAPLFTREGFVYVEPPQPRSSWQIVRFPLESYMVGQAVRPEALVATAAEER